MKLFSPIGVAFVNGIYKKIYYTLEVHFFCKGDINVSKYY